MGGCLLLDDVLAPAQPLLALTLLPHQVEGRVFILVPVRGGDGDGLQLADGIAVTVVDISVVAICHHRPLCLLPPAVGVVEVVVVVVWSCCC